MHEVRAGEMAATGEVPFGRYYGSVDSTPLFLWLLGDYVSVTGDMAVASELWSNVERAPQWIERCDAPEIQYGGSKAFYSSITDRITLPPRELLISAEKFFATAIHECCHASGAVKRLNRLDS